MNPGEQLTHLKMRVRIRWHALSRQTQHVIFTSGIVVFLAVPGVIIMSHIHNTPWPDSQLVNVAHSANYTIYYPGSLPSGFSYVKDSATYSADVLIYKLQFGGDKELFISAVPKPNGVQFDDFYNRILSNKSTVLSTEGKAVMGNASGETLGSLVTDQTWVTLNTKSAIDSDTLKDILSSLKPIH